MAKIERSEVLKALQEGLRLDVAREKTPIEVADKILAVFNVNPERLIQRAGVDSSDTAATTIFTTHATKRTYIVAIHLTTAKSVGSTSLFSEIRGFVFGDSSNARVLFKQRYEPITAGQFTNSLDLSHPIRMEKGKAVQVIASTAIASIDISALIYFYEVEE